ncbi:zinc-binding dehydrogenase [Marinactinospora rubrisoli]|uniref:Zinc-binding dehydrogenase n=1 Tax=Marinactinospora rubrisoli TaxID=2715399 RepID=A0ABW2KPN4_9ACTN
MDIPPHRTVARALAPGGPDTIEVGSEDLPPPGAGEVLVEVAAVGLNHADTLIRSGGYVVTRPFPHPVGLECAGTVVATGPGTTLTAGTRVCGAGITGACASHVIVPADRLAVVPPGLGLEQAAGLAHAGAAAGALARVWPLENRTAVVWGAAGAVGRLLVAILAERGADVVGVATGARGTAVRALGAARVVDRAAEDVAAAVRAHTGGRGADAVFDPIGAATFTTSLGLLAPRGCLITYGELSGPVPDAGLHRLYTAGGVFLTKFNAAAYVSGYADVVGLVTAALHLAARRPEAVSEVAARFPLRRTADGFRTLEAGVSGKVLVLPGRG